MWIVRLALGRPYTFVVMALLIAILGGVVIVGDDSPTVYRTRMFSKRSI